MSRQQDATPGEPPVEASLHRPVLLHELIEHLQPREGQLAVDGTLGGGGVTAALLERVGTSGRVLAIDRDPAAVARARERFAGLTGGRLVLAQGDFAEIDSIAAGHGIAAADSLSLDLGISSEQLGDPARGFSFRLDGPLDMRMDPAEPTPTAADIVNGWDEADLAALIRTYGEESFAPAIARAIVRDRRRKHFTTTFQLRRLVEDTIPRRYWPKRIHPATRTFQALRIEVNHELESLQRGLQAAISLLRPGGRLGVISFHSLEDTLVKNALHVAAQNCLCPPQQPLCTCAHRASLLLLTRKAVKPSPAELALNPRARSARLRLAEKLDPAS
ncbi:MAG TPA: 16S rRNA (cytosine(1402)-N(4))-methyltransferase RsmH [Candidatus Binatia bacterium]|nr:16S rRNA (cytosine(1402)-N(4))-methyltransferase RsmH [Candidatus Binatia bacterium]